MNEWIAIVEENIEHLRAGSKLLAAEGYKVSAIRSKDDLISFLKGNEPDLIFFGASDPYRILSELKGQGKDESEQSLDHMTGLLNEASVLSSISEMITDTEGGLLKIRIDGFDLFDELYGKEKGDAVLIRFSTILRSSLRATDPIGRIGRSDFIAFGEHIREEFIIAEKRTYLQEMLDEFVTEYFRDGEVVPLSVAVGAVVCPDEGKNLPALLQKADEALYLAAEETDTGYAFFWSNRLPKANAMISTEDEVLALLSEREFTEGAYVTSFEHFRSICRFIMRVRKYQEVHALLICFTLQIHSDDRKIRSRTVDHFLEVAAKSLRVSDVMTRRGEDRLSILLSFTDEKYGEKVARRIESQWMKSEYADECRPMFDIHSFQ